MKNIITERSTTTTTTTAAPVQTYGKLQDCTRNLADTGQERYGFGYRTGIKDEEKKKSNLVVVSVFPEVKGVNKCTINDGKTIINGTATCNDNGPSILSSLKGDSSPTQCVKCTTATISADAWNIQKADVLGKFQERQESVEKVEGAINEEEKKNLEYYTKALGTFENEFNNWNQAYLTIKNYIDTYDGQSIYFGFFKSALVALIKTLKYEIAQNKAQGKEDLASEKRNKLENIDTWFNGLPEKNMSNPVGYTKDEMESRFDIVSLKDVWPWVNIAEDPKVPFKVYNPYTKLKGKAAAEKSIEDTANIIANEQISPKTCMKAFSALTCSLGFLGDRRINKACKVPAMITYVPPAKGTIEMLKETVAGCQVQGFYDPLKWENLFRSSKKEVGKWKPYLNYIQNKFFEANGIFNQPTANPCAYVNLQIVKGQGDYTKFCYQKKTIETQQESVKNRIGELLYEVKGVKKQQILENRIVENNFITIIDSIDRPVKYKMKESVDKVLAQTKKFMSKKYDTEIIRENLENFLTVLTGLFGGEQEIKNTFVEKVITEVMANVGFEKDTEFTKRIISDVAKTIDLENIPELLTKSDLLTVKIAEAIPQAYSDTILKKESKSGIMGDIDNTITDAISNPEISKKLTSILGGPVRQALESVESKMGNKLDNWKEAL